MATRLSRSTGTLFYPGRRRRERLEQAKWDFPGSVPMPQMAGFTEARPVSVYAATKLAQEHMSAAWAQAFGSMLVILRLQNVYGSGQSLFNSYTGIISLFCRLAREGRSIPLYEDGAMLRDFVFVEDVASAIFLALGVVSESSLVLDIGTGMPISVSDAADMIARLYGAPSPHVCGKFRHGDVRHAFCDNGAARRALGWNARFQIAKGLQVLANWIDTERLTPLAS